MATCQQCNGSGIDIYTREQGQSVSCGACNGTGSIPDRNPSSQPTYPLPEKEHSFIGKWLIRIGMFLISIAFLTFMFRLQTPNVEGVPIATIIFLIGLGMVIAGWVLAYLGMLMGLAGLGLIYLGGLGADGFSLVNVPSGNWISGGVLILLGIVFFKFFRRK